MGVFNPTLESQVAFEAPVQAPREYNALTDIAKLATGFTKASPRTTQTAADRAVAANFGTEIERARDLKEQGKNNWRVPLENAAIAAVRTGVPINEDLKKLPQVSRKVGLPHPISKITLPLLSVVCCFKIFTLLTSNRF